MLRMYIASVMRLEDITSLMRREDGATMVEYGLMVALIAVVSIVVVTALGLSVRDIFCDIAGSLGAVAC